MSQYVRVLYWSQCIRVLYWRDACLNTLECCIAMSQCISVLHVSIYYSVVLERCMSQYIRVYWRDASLNTLDCCRRTVSCILTTIPYTYPTHSPHQWREPALALESKAQIAQNSPTKIASSCSSPSPYQIAKTNARQACRVSPSF